MNEVVKKLEKRDVRFNLPYNAPVGKQSVPTFLPILEPIDNTLSVLTGISYKQR